MSDTVYFPKTELYPYERQWDLDTVWQLSKPLDIITVHVDCLWEEYKDAWCWQWEEEKINNQFYLDHMVRVMDSDLNYPIILSEEGLIFDGVHRLMKAKFLGFGAIYAVKFDKDPTPIEGVSSVVFGD